MQNQKEVQEPQQVQRDERDNLLSQSSLLLQQNLKQQSSDSRPETLQTIQNQQDEIIDPIEQILKKNNIMPLIAVIDNFDLDRKIQDKPLLSLLATKFVPLQQILQNKQVNFPLDDDRRTPLHYAIEANDVKAAAWLISKGNPNQQDNFGNTPILDAIRLGRRRCFLLCLKNKLYDQRAPIYAAMYNRHWELKILHGVKINIFSFRDQENKSVFERALQYNSFDCAEFMIKIKPDLKIEQFKSLTQSKGLIRKLKKIQRGMSIGQRIKQIIRPLLIIAVLYFSLGSQALGFNDSLPYESTRPFYLVLMLLIIGLYGLMYLWGTVSKDKVEYKQKNTLSQILMEPNYKTLQEICPICTHFTEYQYDHCYVCGCCVQKFHLHSFVCVNKSNQVFWIACEFIWLYLSWSILHQFLQFLSWRCISISNMSSLSLVKFFAQVNYLVQHKNFIGIVWLVFLVFLFIYQLFYCFSLFGMMCMRRKYQEIIYSEKYLHLYHVVKIQDNFMNKEKKIFERGFFGGLKRCARNVIVYFFVQD